MKIKVCLILSLMSISHTTHPMWFFKSLGSISSDTSKAVSNAAGNASAQVALGALNASGADTDLVNDDFRNHRERTHISLEPKFLYILDPEATLQKRCYPSQIRGIDRIKTLLAMHLCLFHNKAATENGHPIVRLPKDLLSKVLAFLPDHIPNAASFNRAYKSNTNRAELVTVAPLRWVVRTYQSLDDKGKNVFTENELPLIIHAQAEKITKRLSADPLNTNFTGTDELLKYVMADDVNKAGGAAPQQIVEANLQEYIKRMATDTERHKEQLASHIKYLLSAQKTTV